jgi:hypothetical protein
MYCPKCGAEAMQTQRFCKLCGTNLELIHDTLKGGDSSHAPFGIDVEKLTQNAVEFAKSWKSGLQGQLHGQWSAHTNPGGVRPTARELRRKAREEARLQNLPKPKEYLSYSWQHNLRNGLISVFTGAGLGILLYFLGQEAINSGVIREIPRLNDVQKDGIIRGLSWVWLIGLMPVLKGFAQIIYAAFFGESIATLSERFTARPTPLISNQDAEPTIRDHATSPAFQQEQAERSFDEMAEPPSSVTERTTHIFDSAKPQTKRETQ